MVIRIYNKTWSAIIHAWLLFYTQAEGENWKGVTLGVWWTWAPTTTPFSCLMYQLMWFQQFVSSGIPDSAPHIPLYGPLCGSRLTTLTAVSFFRTSPLSPPFSRENALAYFSGMCYCSELNNLLLAFSSLVQVKIRVVTVVLCFHAVVFLLFTVALAVDSVWWEFCRKGRLAKANGNTLI